VNLSQPAGEASPTTCFLLSPAYCGGRRAKILLRSDSTLPIAQRLRNGSLTLAEAFSFMSGLYFRGKITYARTFAAPADATLVITPTRGLQLPDSLISAEVVREFAGVDILTGSARYLEPLERDLAALTAPLSHDARVVLLGSIATAKYVDVLVRWLGTRLYFPVSFAGRGDMSRGGLLLRHAASGVELDYAVLDLNARRHGTRPPRLDPWPVIRSDTQ